ncbi:DUF924 domain-containing protein [Noviherbaspirillum cavernae]|uniref:DUF924 domain-containing protein n=1 Tax=Noviherbaspirillum cavernae TaxID=2320862 RepID=A0A418WWY6_9BURK|nr:DUF924 family protein [Noviherbaspirillum cavernae]RJG04749.1 DUF924 domain-containing protein [Noviherbaspirillum cavernae]
METESTIREFWFGSQADDSAVASERAALWWSKNPDVDAAIRQRFAALAARAASRELDAWNATPHGTLALILLTDQFPRNIHRDTPQAFASDPLARAWCSLGLGRGDDLQLRPIERVFFYLPLEHSESLDDQERSVALFERLAANVAAEQRPAFDGFLDYARRHRDIIARFGRFPHRNRILGRTTSMAETAFLTEKGSSF